MAQHAPSHPWKRDLFAKEDASDPGRNVGKRVPHAPDDEILKGGGLLDKGGLVGPRDDVALVEEFFGELEDYCSRYDTNRSVLFCLGVGGVQWGLGGSGLTEEGQDLDDDLDGLEEAQVEEELGGQEDAEDDAV